MPLAAAVAIAVIATGLVGVLLQLLFISWLKNPAVLRMIIITIGLSILAAGGRPPHLGREGAGPALLRGARRPPWPCWGARISPQVLWVLAVSALMVAALTLFFRHTLTGRAMRACSSNATAARLCGIRTSTLVTLSFFIAAAMGALAGVRRLPAHADAVRHGHLPRS